MWLHNERTRPADKKTQVQCCGDFDRRARLHSDRTGVRRPSGDRSGQYRPEREGHDQDPQVRVRLTRPRDGEPHRNARGEGRTGSRRRFHRLPDHQCRPEEAGRLGEDVEDQRPGGCLRGELDDPDAENRLNDLSGFRFRKGLRHYQCPGRGLHQRAARRTLPPVRDPGSGIRAEARDALPRLHADAESDGRCGQWLALRGQRLSEERRHRGSEEGDRGEGERSEDKRPDRIPGHRQGPLDRQDRPVHLLHGQ